MSDNRLKSLAERIERLMDERDGIQSDIRDIYAEAKSAGYVPKVLRKAITRKRMAPDKRDEEDTILDLYEDALSPSMRKAVEMAARNASAREIEAATGIDQATVARSVSLNKKSETAPSADEGHSADPAEPVREVETVLIDGLGVSGKWREGHVSLPLDAEEREAMEAATGSATVVATGNLDALSPDAALPREDLSHSTDDVRAQYQQHLEAVRNTPDDAWERVGEMPAGLRRTPTVRA